MKRTPLYEEHQASGARMIPFGDWEMPERYTSILEEHRATRTAAGLFDLSHMGEFYVSGPGAEPLLRYLLTNDIRHLQAGAALYSPMCDESGGIVDDVIVYRLPYSSTHYLVVVNASNVAKDLEWITSTVDRLHLRGDVDIDDRSEDTALIALQGPRAESILQELVVDSLTELRPFHLLIGDITDSIEAMIARTGYTGEDGFEIYVNKRDAPALWRLLLERGREHGLVPVGLGARDTLRLEARLALYGQDIDITTTPLEAGLGRWVAFDEHEFCGRDVLEKQQSNLSRRLVGLKMADRAIPRAHYPVVADGRRIGEVTSGTFSPTLNSGIALAYLQVEKTATETAVEVDVRGQLHPAMVVPTPFYRRRKV